MTRKTLKKFLLGAFALSIFLSQPTASFADDCDNVSKVDISNYIYEPSPDYNEVFTNGFLKIDLMMKNGFTRYEALEVQNQMRDMLNANPIFKELELNDKAIYLFMNKDKMVLNALQTAIDNVKEKKIFEHKFVQEPLKNDEFYVAFDLDDTLLSQYYSLGQKGSNYYDYPLTEQDYMIKPVIKSPKYITLTSNWEKALKDIAKIPNCKGIFVFTAKDDVSTNDIVDTVKIDGKPLRNFLKGVFARNHLYRENSPTKITKDMRLIDETLKHIILVDDNPTRIFEKQQENLKEFPKFNADVYYKAKEAKDKKIVDYFDKLMPTMVNEIKESAEYAKKNNITFVEAYYPYSMKGEAEVLMLIGQGYSLKDANEFVRKNHKIFETPFFYFESKTF